MKISQIKPDYLGVCINLNVFPFVNSAARLYMCGNMIPKSVVTAGRSTRRIVTGFERQYGSQARRIIAPANMTVDEMFYVGSLQGGNRLTDEWNPIYVVFKNDEKNSYDVLELPRYNTQNSYIGFEYVYDKDIMRRLKKDATFAKGTIFGISPRVSEGGEWMFGMETNVAAMSSHMTEEDGIVITESYAREKMRCMFKHEREFGWMENDFIPLDLYGDKENPRPFPENNEYVRPDGIVMGFRQRITENALVSLTKKALSKPDLTYDRLQYCSPNALVMGVEVASERFKGRSHNKQYTEQGYCKMINHYEKSYNQFCNNIILWYERKNRANGGNEIPITERLDTLVRWAYANRTVNIYAGTENTKINTTTRSFKRTNLKDWNVKILMKEDIIGRAKFKLTGMNGDKGVAVKVIPDDHAPMYPDGTRAEVIVNNTPAFRRQIYAMLMELSINFINIQIHKEVVQLRLEGNYDLAYAKLLEFYETGFPDFAEIIKNTFIDKQAQNDHVDYVAKDKITVQVRSDSSLYGVAVIDALRKKYKYKPQKATFVNSLGERVETENPILISSLYYMLLDKFGTDMSSQALPKSNLFGMPAKLNDTDKNGSWHRDIWNRNTGETEGRARINQAGTQEAIKLLAMAYSPEIRTTTVQRLLRANDPFNINQIVKPEQYMSNRAVQMASSMLSDSGYALRHEIESDRTKEGL